MVGQRDGRQLGFSKGEFRKLFDFIAEANFDIDGIVDGSVDVIDEINKLSDEKCKTTCWLRMCFGIR